MKKTLLFTMLCIVCANAFAQMQPVPKHLAARYAERYLDAQRTQKDPNIDITGYRAVLTNKQDTALHIFEFGNHEGFVVMAADYRIPPIQAWGYTQTGNLIKEAIPPVEIWMSDKIAQAEVLFYENGKETNPDFSKQQWAAVSSKSKILLNSSESTAIAIATVANPIPTAIWDQGDQNTYYNDYVESKEGTGKVNGCGPVACGILMQKYQHPKVPLLTHRNFSQGPPIIRYGAITWSNCVYALPNPTLVPELSLTITQKNQREAVGNLIHDIGKETATTFGTSSSSMNFTNFAGTNSNTGVLSTVFRYQHSGSTLRDPNNTVWFNKIKTELAADRLVLYYGKTLASNCVNGVCSTPAGAHLWVVDGYQTSDLTNHCNWGWNGLYNTAWYNLQAFTAGGHTLTQNQFAVTGIKPCPAPSSPSVSNVCVVSNDIAEKTFTITSDCQCHYIPTSIPTWLTIVSVTSAGASTGTVQTIKYKLSDNSGTASIPAKQRIAYIDLYCGGYAAKRVTITQQKPGTTCAANLSISNPNEIIPNEDEIELSTASFINIYPNPVLNTMNFEYTINDFSVKHLMEYSITDITGKTIWKEAEVTENSVQKNIETSNIPNGIYLLKILDNDVLKTQKFIVQH
jgi:Peptidase C10 family/Secretion system C-terminal sorting domain/Spi protease inhibitor